MKKEFFVVLCVALLVGMMTWKCTESGRQKRQEEQAFESSSDASRIRHQITICGDEWLGYAVFRSPRFRRELEDRGVAARFEREPDFQKRFEKLALGECDLVCATIDSYLVNGQSSNYPGVILFGIDESYGGDAIIAGPSVSSLDDLKRESISGALVGYSPSEFLLKSQIAHFGLDALTEKIPSFRVEDAPSAFNRLRGGGVDFAVLWEPFASKALQEISGSHRIMDTRQARAIIYDVAIASRTL
ncbi:MAG: hypothetical protein AAF191_03030, partial [Verrucomicrobiota bacterium]